MEGEFREALRGSKYYFGTTTRRDRPDRGGIAGLGVLLGEASKLAEGRQHSYDIFEGTEQIQQLVIARAISGVRIE